MSVLSTRTILGALLTATAGLALVAGCTAHHPEPAHAPLVVVQPASFVGSAACAECHQAVYAGASHSRHALTLHVMSRKDLGKSSPPKGKIDGTRFVLLENKDGDYAVGNPRQSDYVSPLDYAIGSGKTGMTYVSVVDGGKLVEFRMSYFPARKSWYITPGQERLDADSVGKVHPSADARKCFACHAVTLPAETPAPQEQFFGVGCEACHGPGSTHIAAMRSGQSKEIRLERLASLPATRLNDLCGKCHGTEQEVKEKHLPLDLTNRLQAFGLTQSQCFKQSKDTLSCITCHDPHANANTDPKTYVAICLQCHSAALSSHRPPQLQNITMKSCPVNPTDKCIGCHMPKRSAIPNTKLPTFMADHFIRVHR